MAAQSSQRKLKRWVLTVAVLALGALGWWLGERHRKSQCPELEGAKAPLLPEPQHGEPIGGKLGDKLLSLGLAERNLAGRLMQALISENPNRNIVISPHAITSALAALALASTGETRAEILSAIEFDGSVTELDQAVRYVEERIRRPDLTNELPPEFTARYRSGSGFWFPPGVHPDPKFVSIAKNDFGASTYSAESARQSSDLSRALGRWARDTIGARVPDPAVGPGSDLGGIAVAATADLTGLLDALFAKTITGVFHGVEGAMSETRYAEYGYYQERSIYDFGEEIGLGFGQIEVSFLLPGQDHSPAHVPKLLWGFEAERAGQRPEVEYGPVAWTAYTYHPLLDATVPNVTRIPLFDIQTQMDLRDALRKIGIKKIFDPRQAVLTCAVACGAPWYHRQKYVSSFWNVARLIHDPRGRTEPQGRAATPYKRTGPFALDRPFFVSVRLSEGFLRYALPYAAWIADVQGS